MTRNTLSIVILAAASLIGASSAAAQAPADRWTLSLTPYLWLPSTDGNIRYGPPPAGGASPNVSVNGDVVIDGAFLIAAEARKGRWSIMTDFIYLNLGSDQSRVSIDFNPGPGPINIFSTSLDLNTQTDIKGKVWNLVGGYSVIYQPRHTMDIIGGFRYLNVEATTNWQLSAVVAGPGGLTFGTSGNVTRSEDYWDAIVGVRGRVRLGDGHWFVPYHLDAGAGSSSLTWQGLLGVGYSFKWADFLVAYRYLAYEQNGNKLIEDFKFYGFGAGLTFRF